MNTAQAIKHLTGRRLPTQARSQKKVQSIIDATIELLLESEQLSSANLTTHRIAKKAQISVGSLYQYFPNAEAVLYEIYRKYIEIVLDRLKELDTSESLILPRDEFFDRLFTELTTTHKRDLEIKTALRTEIRVYSSLAAIESEQAKKVAKRLSNFFKYYGSTWSDTKLEQLGLFLYYIDWGAWMFRKTGNGDEVALEGWAKQVYLTSIAECFK